MNERRQVGQSGPQPITMEAINAYTQLTGRVEMEHKERLLRFIAALDRVFLADFYEKQAKEMEEMRKKQERAARRSAIPGGRR